MLPAQCAASLGWCSLEIQPHHNRSKLTQESHANRHVRLVRRKRYRGLRSLITMMPRLRCSPGGSVQHDKSTWIAIWPSCSCRQCHVVTLRQHQGPQIVCFLLSKAVLAQCDSEKVLLGADKVSKLGFSLQQPAVLVTTLLFEALRGCSRLGAACLPCEAMLC